MLPFFSGVGQALGMSAKGFIAGIYFILISFE
jgi:hypothetical protein